MAVKLWTNHFMRICITNFLLFISLYMLFPVIPQVMAERLGVSMGETGIMFVFFTLGMFLVGPFHAYLVDAYKRKNVCMFSFITMVAATAGYAFVSNITELLLLCLVQGVSFGMATTAGITIAIDVTNTGLRSPSNVSFSWIARMGMIVGIALGVWLNQMYDFKTLLYVSVATGALGILSLSGVYVPFRAPIVTKIYSFDRFLLLRGWVPMVNLVMIAFVFGLLIPVISMPNIFFLGDAHTGMPFFIAVGAGFLLSFPVRKYFNLGEKTLRLVIMGIGLMMLSLSLLSEWPIIPAVLLGLGLGLVTPEFLLIFVKLSQHCQRGTANTTHLLAWEVGITSGIATTYYIDADSIFYVGRIIACLSLLFYILVTHPYYKRMKIR